MIYVADAGLLKKAGGMYKLTQLVSQRAKELNKGAKKLVEINSANFITIALEEFRQGLYGVESKEKENHKSQIPNHKQYTITK